MPLSFQVKEYISLEWPAKVNLFVCHQGTPEFDKPCEKRKNHI
jgi:hypothetical protein